MYIIRIHSDRINNFAGELADPGIKEKLNLAGKEYLGAKVAQLLNYEPGIDYKLPVPTRVEREEKPPTGYYLFSQIMGLDRQGISERFGERVEGLGDREFSELKYKLTKELCNNLGVRYPEEVENGSRTGVNHKAILKGIRETTLPLQECFEKINLDSATGDLIINYIARRYAPEEAGQIEKSMQRIASMFGEMYSKSKRHNFLMPRQREFLAFFMQVATRVFGEKTSPLNMFAVTCPRYNEQDGLSETASAYLAALPHLASILTKYEIPCRGYVLVDDAEERVAGGLYLSRLGLTKEAYGAECARNVKVVNQAVAEDPRMSQVTVHLFRDMFPGFVDVVANLERRIYELTLSDSELRLSMAKIADARFPRHTKILSGQCDFSDSFYLTIHYAAEYMALGYLCRLRPELSGDSFIVNYNSPNVGQFNNLDLLARCIKDDVLPEKLVSIPAFQVKLY